MNNILNQQLTILNLIFHGKWDFFFLLCILQNKKKNGRNGLVFYVVMTLWGQLLFSFFSLTIIYDWVLEQPSNWLIISKIIIIIISTFCMPDFLLVIEETMAIKQLSKVETSIIWTYKIIDLLNSSKSWKAKISGKGFVQPWAYYRKTWTNSQENTEWDQNEWSQIDINCFNCVP